MQKEPDAFNCGPFTVAFAAEILNWSVPIKAHFDVRKMQHHLIVCLIKKKMSPISRVDEIEIYNETSFRKLMGTSIFFISYLFYKLPIL